MGRVQNFARPWPPGLGVAAKRDFDGSSPGWNAGRGGDFFFFSFFFFWSALHSSRACDERHSLAQRKVLAEPRPYVAVAVRPDSRLGFESPFDTDSFYYFGDGLIFLGTRLKSAKLLRLLFSKLSTQSEIESVGADPPEPPVSRCWSSLPETSKPFSILCCVLKIKIQRAASDPKQTDFISLLHFI